MSKTLLLLPFLLSIGCASTRSGYSAVPNTPSLDPQTSAKGVQVRSQEIRDLRLNNYANFDFTLENVTGNPVKIKNVYLDFSGSPYGKDIRVIEGNDLVVWSDVAQRELVVREYNTQMILASTALIGATVAASSPTSSAGTIGAVSSIGALGVGAGLEVKGAVRDLQRTALYPRNDADVPVVPRTHLYSGDLSIPPHLYTKKWLTVYHPNNDKLRTIRVAKLWLEYEDGAKESFDVKFRSDRGTY